MEALAEPAQYSSTSSSSRKCSRPSLSQNASARGARGRVVRPLELQRDREAVLMVAGELYKGRAAVHQSLITRISNATIADVVPSSASMSSGRSHQLPTTQKPAISRVGSTVATAMIVSSALPRRQPAIRSTR